MNINMKVGWGEQREGKTGGSQGKRKERRQEGPVNPNFKSLIWDIGMGHTSYFV